MPQSPTSLKPGRVHQKAAGVERQHHRRDGGVLAPAHLGAELADAELESRLHRVQQARLAGAGGPGDHRDPAGQCRGEGGDAFPGLGAGGIDRIAGRAAAVDEVEARIEVDLVDHHGGGNRVGFGDDQQAVDELGNGSGVERVAVTTKTSSMLAATGRVPRPSGTRRSSRVVRGSTPTTP